MWIIRYAIAIVLIIALVGFAIQNSYQQVVVNIANKTYTDVPLNYVIFVAFCIGMIFWFVISVIQYFKMMTQLAEQRKENRLLRQEITTLRNLPFEDISDSPDEKKSEEGSS